VQLLKVNMFHFLIKFFILYLPGHTNKLKIISHNESPKHIITSITRNSLDNMCHGNGRFNQDMKLICSHINKNK
jgi:hypothetical protein